MNHREPGAGHSDAHAGAPGGEAVWESELPWEFPAPDDTAATTVMPPVPAPAPVAADTAPAPAAPVEPAVEEAPLVARPPARRPGGRRSRNATGERPVSRGHLAKPILAGAGVLSALFLLGPHLLNDDAPSRAVQAGAEDIDPEIAPATGSPEDPAATPAPTASGAPRGTVGSGAGHDRIAEVAAAVPTGSGSPVAATGRAHAPAGATTTRSATPRATTGSSAPPRQQQQWTSTAIDGTSVLEPGQSWSTNRIVLAFQGDGNLVLYDRQGTPLWWSGTAGQGGVKAVFQADGNLAVYAGDARTVWSSRTDGHDGSRLVLRADGNMVIEYGGTVLWSTGTAM
ncbi:hypothetical protein AB0E75_22320 [Streptomyces griseoviridis]|uniref:Bulb-type lectin domain-containing protein n=1 Tax=Streptomyces griseoviridis TaxID=45398 RepID=A0A918LKE5_STRGD|nr:hypothetical protein [Streptomyces niveoruber]GGS62720.1 hypothetical protein GCM10010238_59740 [Streptomyces niveoruber]